MRQMHPLVHHYTDSVRTGHSKVSYVLLEMLQDARKARGYGLFCFVGILSSPTFLYGCGGGTQSYPKPTKRENV